MRAKFVFRKEAASLRRHGTIAVAMSTKMGSPRQFLHLLRRAPGIMLRRVDRAFWKLSDGDGDRVERIHEHCSQPFGHLQDNLNDPRVAEVFGTCNGYTQEEYIHRVKGPVMIDPATGFILLSRRTLLRPSLPYDYQAGRPSAIGSLVTRAGPRRALKFDRVISFRDVHEHNYFHFFNDVLTKIPLLERAGLLDAPIIVGHRLYLQRFFQDALPALRAHGLRLIDQGERFVVADEVIYCKAMPYSRSYFDRVINLLNVAGKTGTDTGALKMSGRKVFLTRRRSATSQRLIANNDEVEALMISIGFEVHDMVRLSLQEQINLFSETRWLVSIHGAGLTNVLFRRGSPMTILELFPTESIPPHYYWLAMINGFNYQGLVCGRSGANGAFNVPLERFEDAIAQLSMGSAV